MLSLHSWWQWRPTLDHTWSMILWSIWEGEGDWPMKDLCWSSSSSLWSWLRISLVDNGVWRFSSWVWRSRQRSLQWCSEKLCAFQVELDRAIPVVRSSTTCLWMCNSLSSQSVVSSPLLASSIGDSHGSRDVVQSGGDGMDCSSCCSLLHSLAQHTHREMPREIPRQSDGSEWWAHESHCWSSVQHACPQAPSLGEEMTCKNWVALPRWVWLAPEGLHCMCCACVLRMVVSSSHLCFDLWDVHSAWHSLDCKLHSLCHCHFWCVARGFELIPWTHICLCRNQGWYKKLTHKILTGWVGQLSFLSLLCINLFLESFFDLTLSPWFFLISSKMMMMMMMMIAASCQFCNSLSEFDEEDDDQCCLLANLWFMFLSLREMMMYVCCFLADL